MLSNVRSAISTLSQSRSEVCHDHPTVSSASRHRGCHVHVCDRVRGRGATVHAAGIPGGPSQGKSILVEIHASWCPTCQAQKPILSKLFDDPKFKNLAVFRVDFDSQKDEVRNFKARIQSTLITYKGKEEVARSVGDTNPDSIADLLALSL